MIETRKSRVMNLELQSSSWVYDFMIGNLNFRVNNLNHFNAILRIHEMRYAF